MNRGTLNKSMMAAIVALAAAGSVSAQAQDASSTTATTATGASTASASSATASSNALAPSISDTPAPSTGTTSASVSEVKPAAASPWSRSVVLEATADMASASNSQVAESNINNMTINTSNYVGLKYKLNAKDSIAVQQYFTFTKVADNGKADQKGVDIGRQRVVYAKGGYKLGASEEFALPFRYYLPTTKELNSQNSLGRFNMPIEIPFTITPKLTVSWLLYPSMSFKGDIEDNTIGVANYAYTYYSITDSVQPFFGIGHSVGAKNWVNVKKTGQTALVDAGLNLSLPRRSFLLLMLSQGTPLENTVKAPIQKFALFRPSETTYILSGGTSF